MKLLIPATVSLFSFATAADLADLPEVVDFNDHVQPILSENCYHCHGPDSSTREPKKNPLRLDREEFAFLERPDGKPSIIKGDSEASEVIKRIIHKDPDFVMPTPASHKKPLKEHEVALLRKWINQGAPYEEHWAFIPPAKPEVPSSSWGNNALDKFIAVKHEEQGLEANKPAEASRLFRRLTFDLTGLPPAPAEVEKFMQASAQERQELLKSTIEQLLKSQGYAEHFGRHWLDAARYADTHGIHIDNHRAIWPYRDWVIDAFRQNMPFDQFTIEQLAGDLLPSPTLEQKIATGFNRCLPTTGEGGAIDEEYRVIYATDRVATTSAVWLGLTTACAACHDHKFDPVSQKDFYALSAFFRNGMMKPMDKNSATHPPSIFAPLKQDRARWNTVDSELVKVNKAHKQRAIDARPSYEKWVENVDASTLEAKAADPDVWLPLAIKNEKLSGLINNENKVWPYKGRTTKVPEIGLVPELGGINLDLGQTASFQARDQVTFGGYLRFEGSPSGAVISKLNQDYNYRGWDIWFSNGKLGVHIIEKWPENAIKAMINTSLPQKKWFHFMVTYDGKASPDKSLNFYIDGKRVSATYHNKSKVKTIANKVPLRLGARHPNTRLQGKVAMHDFRFFRSLLTEPEISNAGQKTSVHDLLAIAPDKRTEKENNDLYAYFLQKIDSESLALNAKREEIKKSKKQMSNRGSMTLISQEKKGQAHAHILDRGEYSLRKDKVLAAIPEIFQTAPAGEGQSRKDLAEWLVSEKNPLTARVTVNRIWYYFFGRGIVETTEDFGIMGARPTHPELLDFLAMEFMESGWDIQHIIRLIVGSATYQLSDQVTSSNREKDPTNLYLSRSPRHRLEAEQIRDMALSASGLLVNKFGGPPAKPYQPEGIWEAVAMNQSN